MAYENLKRYRCGACGHDTYTIYQETEGKKRLLTECNECKSITEINIQPATIRLDWGENGDGVLSFFGD